MSLSDKYYIYLYTYVINCKWGHGLSTKYVVAYLLHFFLFPPGVKVLAMIGIAATLYSFTWPYEVFIYVFCNLSLQVL